MHPEFTHMSSWETNHLLYGSVTYDQRHTSKAYAQNHISKLCEDEKVTKLWLCSL